MELGIRGRRAIVMASSSGLGFACATSLAAEGVAVVLNGRDPDRLADAVDRLSASGHEASGVVGDVALDETRHALLAACPMPDILVTNNSGPSPMTYREWDRETWYAALDANLLAPALMLRAVLDGMVERHFGRIVNITSAMVKAPLGVMGLSSGARAALTAAAKGVSRDVAHADVTINSICPERIDTGRQQQMAALASQVKGISVDDAYAEMAESIAARRIGRPNEVGDLCAYLCSVQASYISGQSISVDGGTFPGIF